MKLKTHVNILYTAKTHHHFSKKITYGLPIQINLLH